MTNYRDVARQLTEALGLQRRPVAVAFRPAPPPGVPKFSGTEPSGVIASTACVGNRVYTDHGEDELYVMIPGKDVTRVAAEAQTIASANLKLSDYHRERRRALATR